ncbi:MAG TPA: hypothetical protein VEA69_23060 [Tepidisphaeraceae bacterium]|nr:hypothetical protein [Tepidisphaeraceae bacterium]
MGRHADLKSAELAVDQIRRAVTAGPDGAAPVPRDSVDALRREVFSLRLGLEVLGQMLIEKGVVSEAELARLAAVLFGGGAPEEGKKGKKGKAAAPKAGEKLDFEALLGIQELPKE